MVKTGKRVFAGARPLIMGILNVTPDSFSDGGLFEKKEEAVKHALQMVADGADIIDIGGESTRPGSNPVSEQEELRRVIPVIETVASRTSVLLSIDTSKAGVAAEALEAGAEIVNDISALRFDPGMAEVVKKAGCMVVLMHMLQNPRTMQQAPFYDNVVEDILAFLNDRIAYAVEQGIERENIIVDPGIGFGKTLEHNLELIRHIRRFQETGCPVLIGVSRKSLIGKITGAPIDDRLMGTAALTAYCVTQGVAIHRVHDVQAMSQVCDVTAAIQSESD